MKRRTTVLLTILLSLSLILVGMQNHKVRATQPYQTYLKLAS